MLSYKTIEENSKKAIEQFKKSFLAKVRADINYADEVAEVIYDRLVDDLMNEVVTNVHRAVTLGYSKFVFSDDSDDGVQSNVLETIEPESDDINCPKCKKLVHASRFAPHLEKCMLQGRSSSRIASQRIANNSKECAYGGGSDDDDDWKATPDKSRSVKKSDGKRKKEPSRKPKTPKTYSITILGETPGTSNHKDVLLSPNKLSIKDSSSQYKNIKEKNEGTLGKSPIAVSPQVADDPSLFVGKCGVKSDITGKYCGRSLRCHRHTDLERAVARNIIAADTPVDILYVEEPGTSNTIISNFSEVKFTPPSTPVKKKHKKSSNFKL